MINAFCNQMAHRRVSLSWLAGLLAGAVVLFTQPRYVATWPYSVIHWIGYLLLVMGTMGRVWCAFYIGGTKNEVLCRLGPYSLCRNPLYVCSYLALLGLILGLRNPMLAIGISILFWIYYTGTVRAEERHLMRIFGQDYLSYVRNVNRFLPALKAYQSAETISVNAKKFQRALLEVMWFMWIWGIAGSLLFVKTIRFEGMPLISSSWILPF